MVLGSMVVLSVIVDVLNVDDVVESLSKTILLIVAVSLSRKTIVGRYDVAGSSVS